MRTKSKPEQWEDSEFIRRGQSAARQKADREVELDRLCSFLVQRGVEPFWANSAIAWVRQAMAGNAHGCTNLRHPCVMIRPDCKCLRRLTVDCTLHSVSGSVPGRIIYTYRPGDGHQVNIKAI